jgi:hypothetical protein
MLLTNNTLRKLELEGNNLGQLTAYAFGKALRRNQGLKFLDLENNQLTVDKAYFGGVNDIFKSLETNETLLSLNMANN